MSAACGRRSAGQVSDFKRVSACNTLVTPTYKTLKRGLKRLSALGEIVTHAKIRPGEGALRAVGCDGATAESGY